MAVGPIALARDIPVVTTPPGGWVEWPPLVLAGCDEPLAPGAPDLRGMWRTVALEVNGEPAAPEHPAWRHVERIEQAGDRLVVTAGGVIHDMFCDGTEAGGVHDVAEFDFATPITVVATFEDGVHTLRPVGFPVVVTRRRDGDHLVWSYAGAFVATLERVGDPDTPMPARTPKVAS